MPQKLSRGRGRVGAVAAPSPLLPTRPASSEPNFTRFPWRVLGDDAFILLVDVGNSRPGGTTASLGNQDNARRIVVTSVVAEPCPWAIEDVGCLTIVSETELPHLRSVQLA